MKLEYKPIYESLQNDLNDIYNITVYTYALEADTQEESNKKNVGERILNALEDIIAKIIGIIDRFILKIKNRIGLLMESEKGFMDKYIKAQEDRKPIDRFKVINYKYTPQTLSSQYGKIKEFVDRMITSATDTSIREDDPLALTNNEFEKYMLKTLGHEGRRLDEILDITKNNFRGEKKEQIVNLGQIEAYQKNMTSYKPTQDLLNKNMIDAKRKISSLKGTMSRIARNDETSDTNKRVYQRRISNLSKVYAFYVSFSSLYFELTIELTLNSRAILKRFYQL